MVILKPDQEPHFSKIMGIYQNLNHPVAIDTSPAGTGKTIIAFKVSEELNLPIFTIATTSVATNWTRLTAEHKANIHSIISYRTLAGVKSNKLSHPYLSVQEYGCKKFYLATDVLVNIIRQGVLIAVDEVSNVKNSDAYQTAAVKTIIQMMVYLHRTEGVKSRILIMSETPMDKVECMESLMIIGGFTVQPYIYKDYQHYEGFLDVVNFCKNIDKETTEKYLPQLYNSETVYKACLQYYKLILKKLYSSAMPDTDKVDRKVYQGYYKLTPDKSVEMNDVLNKIKTAAGSGAYLKQEEEILLWLRNL